MDESHYIENNKLENFDWWFVGRRKIISNILSEFYSNGKFRVLEVGCGTGGNIAMLERYGDVIAVEKNINAIKYAREKARALIYQGSLPDKMPLNIGKFDLICLFDVLEHVEDDVGSVKYLYRQINPGGRLVVTVPSYQFLFGPHDISLHHKRRYSTSSLMKVMSEAGFSEKKITHFNSVLFPPILIIRLFEKIRKKSPLALVKEREFKNTWLNSLFLSILYFESILLKKIKFPFGLSIIAVYGKDDESIKNEF